MREPPPAATQGDAPVQIDLLGAFRVRVGTRVVADESWRLLKARALVKLLALAPGHRLLREELTETLWPEADGDAARRNFTYALHVARQALDQPDSTTQGARSLLLLREGVLSLAEPGTITVDVERFTTAAALARRTCDPDDYRAALARYAGDLLPDDRYEEWALGTREILRESFLEALVELARLLLARGEPADAIATLRRALATAPAHEEAHALLMRAYDGTGQRVLALRQYAHLREALRRELAVEPDPESQRLYSAILAGQTRAAARGGDYAAETARDGSATPTIPAPLTTFIGRERELGALEPLLHGDAAPARLVTLTGSGGCGKTRLALEAARRLLPRYPARLWLVELAALDDPARLFDTIARALHLRDQPGITPTELIIRAVGEQPALLILDNCEHLAGPCARLAATLLGACPGLRLLATSRAALRVAGELVWRVPALALPEPPSAVPFDDALVASLAQGDAARLFLDRATLRVPDFRLTPGNAAAVAAICRRLDGLPLALELAAGRLPTLSVEELAARLDDALGILTRADYAAPTRQQTLRATLDWSYALLTPHEAALLRRLAVFTGSWSLAAAEAICGAGDSEALAEDDFRSAPDATRPAEHSLLEVLARLVDQSLVTVTTADRTTRYALLETVRQYAESHLFSSGEAATIAQRHAAWYLALAEEAEPYLDGAGELRWLERLETEHDNLRAALRRALDADDAPLTLRLCAALWRFWESHSYLAEGYDWCVRALTLPGDIPAAHDEAIPDAGSRHTRDKVILGAGRLAYCRNEIPAASAHLAQAVARARASGDRSLLATALTHLGHVALLEDRGAAQRLYAESLALGRACGDRRIEALNLSGLGNVAIRQQDYDAARPLLTAALDLVDKSGLQGEAAFVLRCLGRIAFAEGNLTTAQAYYERCIARWHELGNRREMTIFQSELGHLALAQGRWADAARLLTQGLIGMRDLAIPQRFPYCLEGFAVLAVASSQPSRALRLAGAASTLRSHHGSTTPEIEGELIARAVTDAHLALGVTAGASAWNAGRALAPDDAIAEALVQP